MNILKQETRNFPRATGLAIALAISVGITACSGANPIAYEPPTDPGFQPETPFEANHALQTATPLTLEPGIGPEDIAVGPDGLLYAGFHDGEFKTGGIVRMRPDGSGQEIFADTKEWTTGLHFDARGNLLAMVLNRGLVSVAPDGKVTPLATELDGEPFLMPNDIDVGPDGRVFFTVTSTQKKFSGLNALILITEARREDGGLYVYDPKARAGQPATRRLLHGLHFGNGVAVDPNGRYVLVVETGRYRVLRHWLTGAQAGTTDVFLENLPGIPNGIATRPAYRADAKKNTGTRAKQSGPAQYWLGFTTRRNDFLDSIHPSPFWKQALFMLPAALLPAAEPYGLVMLIDSGDESAGSAPNSGRVLRSFHDPDGSRVSEAASIEEANGFLYLGGDYTNAVLKFALPEDLR